MKLSGLKLSLMPQAMRKIGKNKIFEKFSIGFILSALCLALMFSSARASDVISVSTTHYPPLSLRDASDGKSGIVVDIAAEVFDRIGQPVEFQFLPWKRALKYAQTGIVDAMLPLFFTTERSKTLEFVYPPIFHLEIVLFARHGVDNNFDGTVNSIRGKSVAFISGTSQNDDFDRARTDGRIHSELVNSIDQQLNMVARGRVDFALAERNAGILVAKNLGLESALVDIPAAVVRQPVYIAFQKSGKNKKTIDKLSKELTAMTIDGTMAKIAAQYGWVKDAVITK